MRIEGRRLLELAVHVKVASEAMLAAARGVATLRPDDPSAAGAAAWSSTVDGLTVMNLQLESMERILRRAIRQDAVALRPAKVRQFVA
jgi:hypothetical protein